jgi:uncharacterized protein (TIGR03067 family)
MRKYATVVSAIVSLIAGVCAPAMAGDACEEAVAKELQAFKGAWRVISKEVDGKKISEEEIKDVILTSDGSGKFSGRRGDKVFVEATARLDSAKNAKAIDVTYTEGEKKGKTVPGIYEIDGDTVRVCFSRPGDDRPSEFSAKAGSGRTLVVYKREKK